ncbi:aspartate aminotransferase family protein [Salinispora arenicola]|uniref:aspartate aminotransferase family protein n=1 Tax=Salinispora arenicola TaxID=168697 RepID=UPI00207A12A2|nr:aminotransferase class III-fold pyridoxal phosphate-dependent enzyme [Salinispora arenicola]MCN0177296.1 aminotransferase class III-fold pyridoxal phosphate-dependent enzyme [Salinispora arenicola]
MTISAHELSDAIVPNSTRSEQLYQRARKVMPGGNSRTAVFTTPYPVYVRSGQGARVVDVDGNERLDFLNNSTALIHGHAHPRIVEVMAQAAARGMSFGMPTEVEITFAEALCGRNETFEHVRFTSTGTEAVMMAVQAARAYTLRPKIAKIAGAYHGAYDTVAINNDGSGSLITHATQGIPDGVSHNTVVIPFNDPEGALAVLRRHADELACVLIDPVPWRIGLVPASGDYLTALRSFCDETGTVLISDEVGSFRIGWHGAMSRLGSAADITVLGKVIAGGMPIGAVAGRRTVMAVFDPSSGSPALPHSGSYNANPVSMSAGLGSLELLTREETQRINDLGESVRRHMAHILAARTEGWTVNGVGSLFRVLGPAVTDASGQRMNLVNLLSRALLRRGVHIGDSGLGCVSTAMGPDEVDSYARAFEGAVADVVAAQR